MAASSVGSMRWANSALNCLPWTLWVLHVPLASRVSPGAAKGMVPTTVTVSSFSLRSRRTV